MRPFFDGPVLETITSSNHIDFDIDNEVARLDDLQLQTGSKTTGKETVEFESKNDDVCTEVEYGNDPGSPRTRHVRVHKPCKDRMMTKREMSSTTRFLIWRQ